MDENSKFAFSLTTSKGNTYIGGIKENSSWHKKLMDAGCTVTQKGDLKIPGDAQNPLLFVESVLGKNQIEKYGGIEFKSTGKTTSQTVEKKEEQTKNNSLRVITNQETKDLIVSGLSKEDKEAHKYIKSFGGKFDNQSNSWTVPNADEKLKQNVFYKEVKKLLEENKALNSDTSKIKKLSLDDAAKHFANSTRAIKCLTTNTINAEVGDKLLKIIPSTGAFTLSPLSDWNLDIVFNPNGDGYLKGKAFMLDTKDLTYALNQTAPSIQTDFKITQDGNDVLVSNEKLKEDKSLLRAFKTLIRDDANLEMSWDKSAFRIKNSTSSTVENLLSKLDENNSLDLDSSIKTILEEHKTNGLSLDDATSSLKTLMQSEAAATQTLTQG